MFFRADPGAFFLLLSRFFYCTHRRTLATYLSCFRLSSFHECSKSTFSSLKHLYCHSSYILNVFFRVDPQAFTLLLTPFLFFILSMPAIITSAVAGGITFNPKSDHPSVQHPETSVSCHFFAAFQRCLETLPGYVVFLLRQPLCAELQFLAPRFVDEILL